GPVDRRGVSRSRSRGRRDYPVRVIAGTARGRTLVAPKGARPTSDLARGALFDMLAHMDVGWERALAGFAGSGALGLEALSRGAGWVDFVERDAGAVAVIRRNLAATEF